ncbi:MAG: hypothetical protein LBS77_06355 [Desulfovibrio sp.]|jgi:hypothetical protein|nr:hypothetical protein [Desulfovibrio sp.]
MERYMVNNNLADYTVDHKHKRYTAPDGIDAIINRITHLPVQKFADCQWAAEEATG